MSGPKDYSPPKRYSMSVFEGKLNTVFSLQAALRKQIDEMKCLRFSDDELDVHFDCIEEAEKMNTKTQKLQKPLVFDYNGKFGQDTYNRIQKEIDKRISELKKAVGECEKSRKNHDVKAFDYKAYRSYLDMHSASERGFNEFKDQVIDNLRNNIGKIDAGLFKESREKIEGISFDLAVNEFRFGFGSKAEAEKNGIIEHVIGKELELNRTRSEISDKAYEKLHGSGRGKIETKKNDLPDESRLVSEKITSLIRNCEDSESRERYAIKLKALMESDSLKETYYFRELHDSILETEKKRKIVKKLGALITDMNKSSTHASLKKEKKDLFDKCISMLEWPTIHETDIEDVNSRLMKISERSDLIIMEEDIQRKEKMFLKSQLLLGLENKGYEVMEDMEVIDFEKENDFLLRVNGQQNYLNLRFKEDGSIRYVFQIPENKDELGTDQKKMKLHEMHVTCTDFNSVIEDLSKMGLKMEIRSEKPIELDSMVSITKKHRDKLKEKKRPKYEKQLKRKFLNP
jgi:hypothetical protein